MGRGTGGGGGKGTHANETPCASVQQATRVEEDGANKRFTERYQKNAVR